MFPNAISKIREWIAGEVEAMNGNMSGPGTLVLQPEEWGPAWATRDDWDVRDISDCRRLQRRRLRGAESSLNVPFIEEAYRTLGWQDGDLLAQVQHGVDDRSLCGREIVLNGHHKGLRKDLAAATEAVNKDKAAGFITTGFTFLSV